MPTKNVTKPPRPNLEGIARTHPIVPIVLAKNNQFTNNTLPEFLEHELTTGDNQVPYSLHVFYSNYLEFVIQKHLRHHRAQYGPKYYHWNIRDAIDRLSKLAFTYYVRVNKITEGMVLRQMEGIGLEKEAGDVRDIEFRSMGLLVQDGVVGRKPVYRFKEQIVMEYLVANYHLLQCLKAVTATQTTKVITGILMDSMSKLPATGDIWRITFGLLNADAHTRGVQKQILEEIIDVSKRTDGMTSFDVTSLCVEAIYESQNAGELTSLLDEFSLNQTLNYSNVFMSKARVAYTIQAAGYLVRATPDVYGLHLANLGLNEEKVGLLADPLNAISDNNLQVLNLSCNPLGAPGIRRLQRFIVKASLLTHLDLSECGLDNTSISMLSEFFMCLPLRYLNLESNHICDSGLLHMLSNLKYVPTLEVLNIANNQLTDRSIMVLGKNIAEFLPNLRSVDLNRNLIAEKGLLAMSKALPGLAYIEDIKIAENAGGSLRATEVITHTWKTKSLRHININMNQIPPEGVLALTKVRASHGDAIPLADDEDNQDDEMMDTTYNHDDDDDDDEHNDTYRSTLAQSHEFPYTTKLQDSQDVKLMMQDTWEKSQSMDLLAGRPDKVRAVPLRRSTSRGASLPRLKDVRRSWHGMGNSLRASYRSTRESLASRSSLRGGDLNSSRVSGDVTLTPKAERGVRFEPQEQHTPFSDIDFIDEGQDEQDESYVLENHHLDETYTVPNGDQSIEFPNGGPSNGTTPQLSGPSNGTTPQPQTSDSMKRSSSHNLRDSLRRSSSNLKDSVKNKGANIRDSFRKRFKRRSSPTMTPGTSIETTV